MAERHLCGVPEYMCSYAADPKFTFQGISSRNQCDERSTPGTKLVKYSSLTEA